MGRAELGLWPLTWNHSHWLLVTLSWLRSSANLFGLTAAASASVTGSIEIAMSNMTWLTRLRLWSSPSTGSFPACGLSLFADPGRVALHSGYNAPIVPSSWWETLWGLGFRTCTNLPHSTAKANSEATFKGVLPLSLHVALQISQSPPDTLAFLSLHHNLQGHVSVGMATSMRQWSEDSWTQMPSQHLLSCGCLVLAQFVKAAWGKK